MLSRHVKFCYIYKHVRPTDRGPQGGVMITIVSGFSNNNNILNHNDLFQESFKMKAKFNEVVRRSTSKGGFCEFINHSSIESK